MVLLIVLGSWAVAAVLLAVLFAAIGRSARREDEALGYTEPQTSIASAVPTVTASSEDRVDVAPAVPEDGVDAVPEAVMNSASR